MGRDLEDEQFGKREIISLCRENKGAYNNVIYKIAKKKLTVKLLIKGNDVSLKMVWLWISLLVFTFVSSEDIKCTTLPYEKRYAYIREGFLFHF